jgi:MYXO-CTERM domain-containing protein
MRIRHGVLALLLSTNCVNQADEGPESTKVALGVVPPTESATWTRVGASNLPDGRYAHALAFDETRQVAVLFGGMVSSSDGSMTAQQDTWEWSPAEGAWKARIVTGAKPAARTGAAMAYDSVRKVFVLFGGRAGSGYDYQDTWEWDPATVAWTNKTGSGAKPSARSQHGMLFDSKAGKILLFGGGRSMISGDIMTVSLAFDDTWEYDGTSAGWTKRATVGGPSARVDFGFAYSSQTNKAYLFGGMEVTSAGVDGTPMQDAWEWDGTAGTWTERTGAGDKPSPRFGHSMAIDSAKGQAAIFGGYDMISGGSLNDVWYWDLAADTWTGPQFPSGASWPMQRQWASLVFNASASRFYLIAGLVNDQGGYGGTGGSSGGTGGYYGGTGGYYGGPICLPGSPYCSSSTYGPTREVWELNSATTTWVDRSAPSNSPGPRFSHAMAADPVTGKVYVFGGQDAMGNLRDDLWEWDGDKWAECTGDIRPPARAEAAMAYDPARKSLILFGGSTMGGYTYYGMMDVFADTWEWNTGTRKWTQLFPAVSPSKRSDHGMVTDSARKKILLYAGYDDSSSTPYPPYGYPYPDAGAYTDPSKADLWEWDGASTTWKDRTPTLPVAMPAGGRYPIIVFDEARGKLTLVEGDSSYQWVDGNFWDWDPESGAWSEHLTGDTPGGGMYDALVSYDSIRRRVVVLGMASMTSSLDQSTMELDTSGPTWYVRSGAAEPSQRWGAGMAFDAQHGVVVLFGGEPNGTATDETWTYSVSGRGNGTGCTATTASLCSSGNCVDGVCCESASCSGPCKSCNVPGKVGACVLASPGTQVAGSCSGDQACDATGACKSANGKICTSAADCASGFCADGVCCNSACTGTCVSCKLAGNVGACSPFPIGTDPENDCSKGTPPCQSTCDGIGACVFPGGTSCGKCGTCNFVGSCVEASYCSVPNTNTRTSSLTSTGTTTRPLTTFTATGTGTGPTSTGITTATSVTSTGTSTGTGPTSTGTSTGTVRTSTGTSIGTGLTSTGTSLVTGLTSTTTSTGTGTSSTATRTGSSTATSGTATATSTPPTGTVTATSTSATGTGSATVTRTGSATITSSGTGTGSSVTDTGTGTPTGTGSQTSTGPGPDAGLATATARDGSVGGRNDGSNGDGGSAVSPPKLGRSGCDCDLGSVPTDGPGIEMVLGLLGVILVWRRSRKRR